MADEMHWPDLGPMASRKADAADLVRRRLGEVYNGRPNLRRLVEDVQKAGRTLLVGGAVRDWINHRACKDLDFVVDAPRQALLDALPEDFTVTRFQGYRLKIDNIDVWTLRSTSTLQVLPLGTVGIDDYLEVVPFNADAIAYDMGRGRVLDAGFFRCMDERILRRQFVWHPDPACSADRARRFLKKYALTPSPDLRHFLQEQERVRTDSR